MDSNLNQPTLSMVTPLFFSPYLVATVVLVKHSIVLLLQMTMTQSNYPSLPTVSTEAQITTMTIATIIMVMIMIVINVAVGILI
jgi:uncharacterized membrane protein